MTTVFNVIRQCGAKVRYRTKADAKQDSGRLEQALGVRLRAYHCPHCDLYHFGQRIPRHHPRAHATHRATRPPCPARADMG